MILITGASGKIGKAIYHHLSQSPHRRFATPLHAQMPVESAFAVQKYIHALPELDMVICAHGIYGEAARVENSDPWQWRYAIEVNLLGTYNVCRFALPRMAPSGLMVNIAGGGGMLDAIPFISSYACSKAGIVSLTRTLAAEYPELRINCIFPGMQDSEIHDRLIAAGPEGNPNYDAIKKMRETGEGTIPIENTIKVIDRLIRDRIITGKVIFSRTGEIR